MNQTCPNSTTTSDPSSGKPESLPGPNRPASLTDLIDVSYVARTGKSIWLDNLNPS